MSSLLEQQVRENFRAKWSLWAAVGAGCLAGVSGMFLLQRLTMRIEASQPADVSEELSRLHCTLRELQEEIRQIKTRPLKSALRAPTVSFSAISDTIVEDSKTSASFANTLTTPTPGSEFFSALCSDDEEFYDVESLGEITPKVIENGSCRSDYAEHAERLSSEIRKLQESEDEHLKFFLMVDELMEGDAEKKKKALTLLTENQETYKENAEFLWRLCKATYLVAVTKGLEGKCQKKQEMIFHAVDYGRKAMESDGNSSESHKWYAIAVGSRGEYLGIKEKILDGFEFKKHIDKASELAPSDHTIRHLLGRFCYEVAELSWWERKMASTLFAEPPQATMEEARDHFMAAEELKPDGWKENRQFLAKTFIHLKDYKAALNWLDRANEIPVRNPDDQQAQNDVDELLKIYESYR